MPGTRLTETQVEQIRALRKQGRTRDQIAEITGIGAGTVSRYIYAVDNETGQATEPFKLKTQLSEVKKQLHESLEREAKLENVATLGSSLAARQMRPPEWARKNHRPSSKDDAVAVAFLSDLHLDEVVNAAEVRGTNAYNRKIAEKRLKKFFDSTLQLTFDHFRGIKITGLTLPLGGDMFSGNIHEELTATNEATIIESVLFWSEQICAGVKMLEKEFKKIHIPGVVGNHGRLTRKPIMKNRPQDNFDWLLYHMIAREFRNSAEITFDISEAADTLFQIYSKKFLLTHGDQFKGGGGIAGLLSPLMVGAHKKSKRQQAVQDPFDYMMVGHWHQYAYFKNIIVNGSLKGYDEYAFINNFDFEPPQQAYFLVQPDHGITISGPLHIADPGEKYQ
jgi:predicted phosphodiesterase